jgi:hypothetical protein
MDTCPSIIVIHNYRDSYPGLFQAAPQCALIPAGPTTYVLVGIMFFLLIVIQISPPVPANEGHL